MQNRRRLIPEPAQRVEEMIPVKSRGNASQKKPMADRISDSEQSTGDERVTFGQGSLTPQEKRILIEEGVAIPIPGLIPYLEPVLATPISSVG